MSFQAKVTTALATVSLLAGLAVGANAADTYKTSGASTHTMALNTVSNPKDTLVKAKVVDANGNSVGSVDDVILDKQGKPTSLKVDVGGFLGVGDKDVAMKASAFKFDPDRKVLVTNMTKDQIKKLPEVKS
jgi:sporulation protein YlmC with PRC-barrel domain